MADLATWLLILFGLFIVIIALLGYASVLTIAEFERGVVLTLGRFSGIRHPGIRFVIPVLQQVEVVDMRVKVVDVAPQEIITKDNVLVTVNAIVYYKVHDPRMAILDVGNFAEATKEMAQASLRECVGGSTLDGLASKDEEAEMSVADQIKAVLSVKTKAWGVRVSNVEMKEIRIDDAMARAISRQAEAERNRRAAVIEAKGEEESAHSYANAAEIINNTPGAMRLRELATLASISNDRTNTIVFPLPTDLNAMFGQAGSSDVDAQKLISQVTKLLTDQSKDETEPVC